MQIRRLAPTGQVPHRLYEASAESAAPYTVEPPAPRSVWIWVSMLGMCACVCAANMLVTQAAAPRPQADPEQATPVPTEAVIKEKITRIVQNYKDAIQEANEALGREPNGLPRDALKILRIAEDFKDAVQEANAALGREPTGRWWEEVDKLISDLGINRTPSTAAHAAGAGANAARANAAPGRHQRKASQLSFFYFFRTIG